MILEEGRGGMMDSAKYRKVMSDMFWRGIVPEPAAEDVKAQREAEVEEAKKKIGARATPKDALADLRVMTEGIKGRDVPSE